jgi:hypothetical protein
VEEPPPSVERTTVSGKGAGCWKRGGREETDVSCCWSLLRSGGEAATTPGGGGTEAATGGGGGSRGGDGGEGGGVAGGNRWGVGAETGYVMHSRSVKDITVLKRFYLLK